MFMVIGAVVLVLTVFFLFYDFKNSEGTLRKVTKIACGGMLALLALTLIFAEVVSVIDSSNSKGHQRNGGILGGGISYIDTEDGYYHFRQSGFLSSGTDFYVPTSAAELPSSAKLIKSVVIYTDGEPKKDGIDNSKQKNIWTNVAKISTFYVLTIIFAVFWELVTLFALALAIFVIILLKKSEQRGEAPLSEQTDNNT